MKRFQLDTTADFDETQQIIPSPIVYTSSKPIQIPTSSSMYSFDGYDNHDSIDIDMPLPLPPPLILDDDKHIPVCKSPSDGVFSPVSKKLYSKKLQNSEQGAIDNYRKLVVSRYNKKEKGDKVKNSSLLNKKKETTVPSPVLSAVSSATSSLGLIAALDTPIAITPPSSNSISVPNSIIDSSNTNSNSSNRPASPTDMFMSPCSKRILHKSVPKQTKSSSNSSSYTIFNTVTNSESNSNSIYNSSSSSNSNTNNISRGRGRTASSNAGEILVIQSKLNQLKAKRKHSKKHHRYL